MHNEELTLSLTAQQFNQLFPFYIRVDEQLIIRYCGDSMRKLFNFELNQPLLDYFSLVSHEYETLELSDLPGKNYLLIPKDFSRYKDALTLQGEILFLNSTRELVLLGTPRFIQAFGNEENKLPDNLISLPNSDKGSQTIFHPNFPLNSDFADTIKGAAITDSSGAIQWVSSDFEQSLGYRLFEIIGKRPREIIYGKESKHIDPTYVDRMVSKKKVFSFDNIGYNRYGKSFWFRTTVLPLTDMNGEIKGRYYNFEDVSKLKIKENSLLKTESELNASQAILSALIENFDSGVIFENVDREIITINKAVLKLISLDISAEELHGQKTTESLDLIKQIFKYPKKEIDSINKIVAEGKRVDSRIIHLADGKVLKQQFIPIVEAENNLGYLWIYNDVTQIYYANKKLSSQKKYFYRILNEIPSDIVILNTKKEFEFINKAAVNDKKMRKWLIGKTMFDYCRKRKINQALAVERDTIFDEVMKSKTSKSAMDSYAPKNGVEKHILRYFYPFTNKKNEVDFLVVYGIDITQQKLYEKELQNLKTYYEEILNEVPIEIVRFGVNFEYQFINKRVEPDEEMRKWLIAKNDFDYCEYKGWNVSVAEERRKLFDVAISSAAKVSTVIEHVNNEGRNIYMLMAMSAFADEGGAVTHVLGYGTEITDLIESKKKAELQEENLSRLIDVINDGIFTCDKNGTLSYYNTSFLELIEYHGKVVPQSTNISDIFSSINISVESELFHMIPSEGQLSKFPVKILKNNEDIKHLVITIAKLHDNVDSGYVGSIHDISDMVFREEKLNDLIKQEQNLNYSKSQFIRITSHELRTPLAIIMANTELLEMMQDPQHHKVSSIKTVDLLNRIIREVSLMEEMLNGLMMVSKIESGKIDIRPDNVKLDSFIRTIVHELYAPYTDGRHLEVVSKDLQHLTINIDTKLVRHALVNLINNAFKYSKGKKPPILKIVYEGENVTFNVQDFGIGIPEKDQANLFNAFFRASNVGTIQGTGVGLMVVEYVTKLHNGIFHFESKENVGSIFSLTISTKPKE